MLDSNYAILHCSPERLLKIWRQVEQVGQLMGSELLPMLAAPSVIPALGEARRNAEAAFRTLSETALTAMEQYDHSLRADQILEARKILCVSIGKIHAFLRDTFGEIVASDPRSRHDADYFLSKRFAQDIEESEWLYTAVYELDELLEGLQKACAADSTELLPRMQRERMIPPEPDWETTRRLLDLLLSDLMPKLREVLSLRGILAWTTWKRSRPMRRAFRATAGRSWRSTRSAGKSSSSSRTWADRAWASGSRG